MRTKLWIWTTLFLLTITALCGAQFDKNKLGLGIQIGGTKLAGDIQTTNAGLTGGVLATYELTPKVSLSASSSYGKTSSGLDAIYTRIASTTLTGSYNLLPGRAINPFVSLGLAAFHYEATDQNDSAILRNDGSDYTGWSSALQFGLGFQLSPGKQWAVRTVGNYNMTGADELDAISGGSNDGFFKAMIGVIRYLNDGSARITKRSADNWQDASAPAPVEEVVERDNPVAQAGRKKNPPLSSGGIKFVPGTARLLDASKPELEKLYQFLVDNPDEEIILLGKSSKSQQSVNYDLVVARALSIKAYLVRRGVASKRIIVNTGGR